VTAAADLEVGLVPVATILATVELERALAAMGRPPGGARSTIPDPHLGAAVAILEGDDGRRIALAEPSTEGRLAATLARHDEGAAGSYVTTPEGEPDGLDGFRRRAAAAGVPISRVETGPFGPSVLVLTRPATGPHLIVVDRRTLPSPP
jgi:hypothetical protein